MKLLYLTLLFAVVSLAETHTVNLNGYGSDFNVSQRVVAMQDGDTLRFHSDDPGRLVVRLNDDGVVVMAQNPGDDIVFTAAQLKGQVHSVRCSFIDYQGTLQGWEATHDDRYGSEPVFPDALSTFMAAMLALGWF